MLRSYAILLSALSLPDSKPEHYRHANPFRDPTSLGNASFETMKTENLELFSKQKFSAIAPFCNMAPTSSTISTPRNKNKVAMNTGPKLANGRTGEKEFRQGKRNSTFRRYRNEKLDEESVWADGVRQGSGS